MGASIGVVFGSLLMLLVSVQILVWGWPAGPPADGLLGSIPRQIMGAWGVLLFGATTLRGVRGLRGKPRLVVDGDGILDLANSRSPLTIPWDSIIEVSTPKKGFIDLRLKNHETVVASLPFARRQVQRLLSRFGRHTLRYGIRGFGVSHGQVTDRIQTEMDAVELREIRSGTKPLIQGPEGAT